MLENEAIELGRRLHEPIVDFAQPVELHKGARVVEDLNRSLEQDGVELHPIPDTDSEPRTGLVKEQLSIFPELLNPSRVDAVGGQARLKVGFRHGLAEQRAKEVDKELAHDLVE